MVLGPLLTQNVGREDEERQRFRQKRREGFRQADRRGARKSYANVEFGFFSLMITVPFLNLGWDILRQ